MKHYTPNFVQVFINTQYLKMKILYFGNRSVIIIYISVIKIYIISGRRSMLLTNRIQHPPFQSYKLSSSAASPPPPLRAPLTNISAAGALGEAGGALGPGGRAPLHRHGRRPGDVTERAARRAAAAAERRARVHAQRGARVVPRVQLDV